jgi:serine/threonine-protein kinase
VDEDELLPRHVLEAHTVPELPYDFADRVMGALQAAPTITVPPRRSVLPWVIASCTTAIAIAAMFLLMWPRPAAPEPPIVIAAAPTTDPTPAIAVAVPTPVATPPAPPQLGHLVLTVTPRDAIVRIDGQSIAGPSPFVATNLSVGTHAIAIEREGFESWSRTIDVPIGELDLPITLLANAPIDPRPAKPRSTSTLKNPDAGDDRSDLMDPFAPPKTKDMGTLRIGTNAGADPAEVFVDGKRIGTTPIAAYKVAAGMHVVKWKWPGKVDTATVMVVAGETKLIKSG